MGDQAVNIVYSAALLAVKAALEVEGVRVDEVPEVDSFIALHFWRGDDWVASVTGDEGLDWEEGLDEVVGALVGAYAALHRGRGE